MFSISKYTVNKFTIKLLIIALIRYKRYNLDIDIFNYNLDIIVEEIHGLTNTTEDLSHNVSSTVSTINNLNTEVLYNTLQIELQDNTHNLETTTEDLSHEVNTTIELINSLDIDVIYNTLNMSIEEVKHNLEIIIEDLSHRMTIYTEGVEIQ